MGGQVTRNNQQYHSKVTSMEGGWTKSSAPEMKVHHLRWKATQSALLWVILKFLSRGSGEKVARDDGGCPVEGGGWQTPAAIRMMKWEWCLENWRLYVATLSTPTRQETHPHPSLRIWWSRTSISPKGPSEAPEELMNLVTLFLIFLHFSERFLNHKGPFVRERLCS